MGTVDNVAGMQRPHRSGRPLAQAWRLADLRLFLRFPVSEKPQVWGKRPALRYGDCRHVDNVGMKISVSTQGFNDILDITPQVRQACGGSKARDGVAHLFVVGSTAALSTIEFEPGAVEDLKQALERIAPMDAVYQHNEAWHDGNGYAHLRAALMKPSLSIPIEGGELVLGTWQQVILIDFDNRPRKRTVFVQVTAAA
jgi:secondary thiamine-phosphate synthase enzyme